MAPMTPKAIIVLVVGVLSMGVTAWKGPSTWGAVSGAVSALCLFIGTLGVIPKKDQEYIDDLEQAVEQATPGKVAQLKAARKSKSAPSPVTTLMMLAVVVLVGSVGQGLNARTPTAVLQGCNATAQQVGQTFVDGLNVAACILSKVLVGIVDIPSLLQCSGATEQVIIDVINDFEQRSAAGDAGVAAMSSQQHEWLEQAKANATHALAAKAPGK
jgi:hypothetical protein